MARKKRATARKTPRFPIHCRVPVYRSPAPSSMAAQHGRFWPVFRPNRRPRRLRSALWQRDAGAIPPAHQYAILGLAQIGNAHCKPDPDCSQRDRKRKRRDIRQHAMTKIVRLVPRMRIACEIVRLLPDIDRRSIAAGRALAAGGPAHGTRPELEHAMLVVVPVHWPLAFHRCLIRDILLPVVSLRPQVSQIKSAWHGCEILAACVATTAAKGQVGGASA